MRALRSREELPRAGDVDVDLRDEGLDRLEPQLVAQPGPDLEAQPLSVEIAVVVEQVSLHGQLAGRNEGGVRPDGEGRQLLRTAAGRTVLLVEDHGTAGV